MTSFADQYLLRASSEDIVQAFMSDRCRVVPGAKIAAARLYAAYAAWAPRCGFTMSSVAFGRAMRAVGIVGKKTGYVYWRDVLLVEDQMPIKPAEENDE